MACALLGCGGPGEADLDAEREAPPLPRPLELPAAAAPGGAAPAEITLRFIERLPALDYVPGSERPAVEGWPAAGEPVTWRAHLRSWFPAEQTVAYVWQLDGAEVARGALTLAPGEAGTVDLVRPWSFERHEVAIVVDPDGALAEEEERNNRLAVDSDALAVGFYVEQTIYDHFRAHQRGLGMGATTFEDWAQRQIALYNELFRRAVYPETPGGVLERLRLDRITLVPDGALPLDPAAHTVGGTFDPASARPNLADRTVDLQWGFPARLVSAYGADEPRSIQNQLLYYSGFVQHELGHARGLIDVYGMALYDGLPGHSVDVAAATDALRVEQVVFNDARGVKMCRAETGLMAAEWTYLDRLSAIVWNRLRGQRARRGNYNEPEDIGWFLNALLPADNRVRIVDAAGAPVAGVELAIYQGTPSPVPPAAPYGRVIDGRADLTVVTDARGEAALGPNPFAASGPVVHTEAFSNAVVLVRASKDGEAWFCLTAAELIERAVPDGPAIAVRRLAAPRGRAPRGRSRRRARAGRGAARAASARRGRG
jgi:hypothetical protein